jgi:TonB family protein
VRDAKVERPLCTSCDQEALRLVQAMPVWTPARSPMGQPAPVHVVQAVGMSAVPPQTAPAMEKRPAASAPEEVDGKVYTYVEQMPQLPGGGGNAAIGEAIKQRIPASVAATCSGGRVFVAFTVRADGSVTDAKITKGQGSTCDEATLAAVRKLPRFVPGRQNGRAVAVAFLGVAVIF